MTAEQIARALGGRRCGRGWMVRCPAHDDRSPSLSVRDRDGGGVLVFCFSGCEQASVIVALRGLGLWPNDGREWTPEQRRDFARWRADLEVATLWARVAGQLADALLDALPLAAPERPSERRRLTDLLHTLAGPGLVEEYRRWCTEAPALTAAMVSAGRRANLRLQRELAAHVAGIAEVE